MKYRRPGLLNSPGVLLGLILAAACVLRVLYLDRWLPEVYEEATPVFKARDFWGWETGRFDFDPRFFNYPALSFYVHFAFQAAFLVAGFLSRQITSLTEFRQLLGAEVHWFVLLGRGVTVLFDLGTVGATYLLGKRLGGQRSGLLAALLVAVNSLHIRRSQFVLVDIPLVFFAVLALLCMLEIAKRGRRSDYLRAGLFTGLAAATKYTAGLLVVPLAAAGLLRAVWREESRVPLQRLGLAIVASLVIFILFNPFCLLSFDLFISHFSLEREHMAVGHFGQDLEKTSAWFYAGGLWRATGVAGIAALLSLVQTIRERDRERGLLFLWIIFYLAVVSSWSTRAQHYLLPVVPAALVAGTLGIDGLVSRLAARGWKSAAMLGFAGLYVLLQGSLVKDHYAAVSSPDTRVRAAQWIEENIPAGALIALEHYTYYPDERSGRSYLLFRLPINVIDPQAFSPFYATGWYENFDYVILSSYVYQRYWVAPEEFPIQMEFYRHLEQRWNLVRRFAPDGGSGPEIAIFQNPSADRPDLGFDLDLYRGLAGVDLGVVLQFLRDLGQVLREAGFEGRARDAAEKAARIERIH